MFSGSGDLICKDSLKRLSLRYTSPRLRVGASPCLVFSASPCRHFSVFRFLRVTVSSLLRVPPSSFILHFSARRAEITRMIASPEGPTFNVPTTTGSPSLILMSVFSPVLS